MYSSDLYHTHRSNSRPNRHFRFYVNTQENPPRSSWEHPHGPAPPSGPPPFHYAPPSGRPPATGDRGFNQPSSGGSVLCPAMSDFRDLVEHGQFVDKTLALCDFLANGVRPVHLLLRPRRSGKTTLLRMFR
jgi:hypothetical protein